MKLKTLLNEALQESLDSLNEEIKKPIPDFFKPIFAKLKEQNFDINPSPEQLTDLKNNPNEPYVLFSYQKIDAQEEVRVVWMKDSPTDKVLKGFDNQIPETKTFQTGLTVGQIYRGETNESRSPILDRTYFRPLK